jgi:hypothetical protein
MCVWWEPQGGALGSAEQPKVAPEAVPSTSADAEIEARAAWGCGVYQVDAAGKRLAERARSPAEMRRWRSSATVRFPGGFDMKRAHLRVAASAAAALTALVPFAPSASADPVNAKNAFRFTAWCGGQPVSFVVNSANGQGQGVQDNDRAGGFSPGLVVGSHQVFTPTAEHLTFTFVTPDGQSFTDQKDLVKNRQVHDTVTCVLDVHQPQPDGSTFSLTGTVSGVFH